MSAEVETLTDNAYDGWGQLLSLWPERPWEFGELLCVGIATRFEGMALSKDAAFIEDMARAIIRHIETLGFDFGAGVDVMVLDDGARRATGDLPRLYTAYHRTLMRADRRN